ncbi:TfoX/Sxy family protein [Rhodanobacter sp. MP7CTX1]|jgi:TfoX/Sxy family transcriptional regulator of competence genes|uniref:TfoX/Sxy family protein n=1 Tax=Rhodanobacter sp. MP7CTX1 TaxID=2723084 RepID=UPI0016108AE9|nr:TfoX/Sxy family protein [Rhodanobacter sp. MP7CTX1]MBB6189770.1 TfoX/Sxy family transcriptional regulator of competence genes [Rhodanobacter sp. MP7CTX1]
MPASLDVMRRDLEDAAAHLGKPHDLRFKAMFGGLMAYLDEKPCAWLTPGGLALKLAAVDQRELLQLAGAERLIAKPGAAPSRHYIIVPALVCHDTKQLAGWLARSAPAFSNGSRSRHPGR